MYYFKFQQDILWKYSNMNQRISINNAISAKFNCKIFEQFMGIFIKKNKTILYIFQNIFYLSINVKIFTESIKPYLCSINSIGHIYHIIIFFKCRGCRVNLARESTIKVQFETYIYIQILQKFILLRLNRSIKQLTNLNYVTNPKDSHSK